MCSSQTEKMAELLKGRFTMKLFFVSFSLHSVLIFIISCCPMLLSLDCPCFVLFIHLFACLFCCFVLRDMVSLCSPGSLSVPQAGLEFEDPPASASRVHTTTA